MPDLEFMYGAVLLGFSAALFLITFVLHFISGLDTYLKVMTGIALVLSAFGAYASYSYLSDTVTETTTYGRFNPRVIGDTSMVSTVGIFLGVIVAAYAFFWILARKNSKYRSLARFTAWLNIFAGVVAIAGVIVGHYEWSI